ncbi:MAG: DUF2249 domain-containing protein [candidate division NC10 bacterium]|nr:DUF2249 domain-containing protein [candidate division NC10 bacterium]
MKVPSNKIVTVDVREDIRLGREPFDKIMAAVGQLEPGETLLLINSFEPLPLYRVMAQNGFTHLTERTADGAWKIYFRRGAGRTT